MKDSAQMITIERAVKKYGDKTALNIPALTIGKGEIFGLVGNNGAGKTTFLRALLDLIKLNEGSVSLAGIPVKGHDSWKSFTGSYLDESFLIDYLTPEEYFRFAAHFYGDQEGEVDKMLKEFEEFLGDDVMEGDRYIRELSSGNRKKVGIVAAMFIKPRILLLDEPFAGLDPTSQFRLHSLLARLHEVCDTTMVISSHILEHVSNICMRVTVLEKGSIARDINMNEKSLEELKSYFMIKPGR